MGDRDTLVACLLRAAEVERPRDGLTFIDVQEREQKHSWAMIRDRALHSAGALAEAGVKPGDRVVLNLPTGPGFFDAFFGCQVLGAVPVPVYPPVRLGRLDEYYDKTAAMLRAVDAVAMISDSRVRRLLGQVLVRYKPRLGLISVEDLPSGPAITPHDVQPDDLAMVQFSSGTTVDPKAVALTHRATLSNAVAITSAIPKREEDEPGGVSWLPLYHDMGLIGCVFPAVWHPGPLALIPPEIFLLKPALWLRALSRHRGTVSPAPDFAYALCVERIRDEELSDVDGKGSRCDLSRWVLALNGAEPIRPATLRAFQARFEPYGLRPTALTPVYGLSEASLAVTFSAMDKPFRTTLFDREALLQGRALMPCQWGDDWLTRPPPHPAWPGRAAHLLPPGEGEESEPPLSLGGRRCPGGADEGEGLPTGQSTRDEVPAPTSGALPPVELVSVGTPLPGFAIAIRDPDRQDLPEGVVGELWAKGPSLMRGYLNRTDNPIVEGWLDTGDLGFLWEGELYITGRAKDVLILRGRNHAPQDVERAVDSVDGVRTGCSAAVAEISEEGERLLLFVEVRAPREGLAEESRKAVFAATGLDPALVVLLEPGTLPRTSSGKIRRGDALRRWQSGELLPPQKVTPWLLAGALAKSALGYLRSR